MTQKDNIIIKETRGRRARGAARGPTRGPPGPVGVLRRRAVSRAPRGHPCSKIITRSSTPATRESKAGRRHAGDRARRSWRNPQAPSRERVADVSVVVRCAPGGSRLVPPCVASTYRAKARTPVTPPRACGAARLDGAAPAGGVCRRASARASACARPPQPPPPPPARPTPCVIHHFAPEGPGVRTATLIALEDFEVSVV